MISSSSRPATSSFGLTAFLTRSMADTVLDDALADFDVPADRLQAASVADVSKQASAEGSQKYSAASRNSEPVLNGASSVAHDSTSASKPFNALPERKAKSTAVGQSSSFDPLGKGNLRKKTKVRNPAASRKPDATEPSSSSRAQPPGKQPVSHATPTCPPTDHKEVDKELAQGMAQLMADLAKVRHLKASLPCCWDAAAYAPHEQPTPAVLPSLFAKMTLPLGNYTRAVWTMLVRVWSMQPQKHVILVA